MNDNERRELGPGLSAAVEAWRGAPAPTEALAEALERIAGRPPSRPSRWPAWPLVPGLAAAVTFAVMLSAAPEAWAAVAANLPRQAPPAVPKDAEVRAAMRPLLIVHVVSLMAAYALFFAVWSVTQFEVILGLFGVKRWKVWVARWAPRGIAVGVGLWALGVVLGAFWAREVLGRYWAWDPKETNALLTIAVGLVWLALAWRFRWAPRLATGWAAMLFWVLLDLWWGSLHRLIVPAAGYGLQPAVIRFFLAGAVLNVLLLASAWYAGHEGKIVEGPAG